MEMDNHMSDKDDSCYDNAEAAFSDDEEDLNSKGEGCSQPGTDAPGPLVAASAPPQVSLMLGGPPAVSTIPQSPCPRAAGITALQADPVFNTQASICRRCSARCSPAAWLSEAAAAPCSKGEAVGPRCLVW